MTCEVESDIYIHHTTTHAIMTALDYEVGRRRVVPLVGPQATGKSRLIQEWVNGGSAKFKPHEILAVDIWNPRRNKLKDGSFATAIASITFSQLYGALSELTGPAFQRPPDAHKYWDLQSDARFAGLFRTVASVTKRLNIRALVIDNAQWLDAYTVDRLMELRGRPVARCGLVLCAQLPKHAAITEPFEDQFKVVSAAADACGEWQVVNPIVQADFADGEDSILAKVYEQLAVEDITDDVLAEQRDIAQDWWMKTQGNWDRIARLIEGFDRALSRQRERIVTREVIEQTNRFLAGGK